MNNRNQTLDIAKGLLIILVVFGHSIQYGFGYLYCEEERFFDNIFFRCIYTFHMPLFMLISGYLFYFTNKKSYKRILVSRFTSVGIPFMVYCALSYIVWYNLYNMPHFYLRHFLLTLKSNMWFLSSILLNCIIVSSLTHLLKKKQTVAYLILCVFFSLTFIISDNYIPALHKYMYFYFLVGVYLNKWSVRLPRFFWSKWVFILLTCLTITCSLFYDETMFVYKVGFCVYQNGIIDYDRLYINILRFIVGGGISCWFMRIVFFIKQHIQTLVPFITHIGQETLGIYGFQSVIFIILSIVMSINNVNFNMEIVPLFFCCVILLLCEIAIRLCSLNRYTKLLFLGKWD